MSDVDIEIREKVEDLLQQFHIQGPPIPVDKIAKRLGILLCPLPADDDISGAIVRKDGHVVIAVNPKHHHNRQRFTIAHELGHFFFHAGAWKNTSIRTFDSVGGELPILHPAWIGRR